MSFQSNQSGRKLFARLWRNYLRQYWPAMAVAAVFMVIEGSTLGALSYMLQPMFDLVFVEGRSDAIWWVGMGIFSLFVIRGISGIIQRALLTSVSYRASTKLQLHLLEHALTLDNGFYARMSPGAMIERVQGDVTGIQNLWNMILVSSGRDAVALFSLLIVAISIDWHWTLVAIIGAPLLVVPSLLVQRYVRRKSVRLRDIAAKRTTRLDEIFHGITPIKLNRMERYQSENFRALSDDWIAQTVKTTVGQSSVPALVDFAVGFGFLCVLIYGGPQIIAGEKSIGQFMSFFTAMSLAFQPMRRLGGVLGHWEVMNASLSRIFGLLDTQPTVRDDAKDDSSAQGDFDQIEISFRDVDLRYGDKPVLDGLTFTAGPGTTTALVGQSGAGKSSVFNVLTRLIDATSGQITLNGADVKELKLSSLRGLFSVVSQDALLFDETLRENILLGREDVSDAQLSKVLKDAHVLDFLPSLPKGLETEVGPRGSNLSGGQRQRVAIARALLRDTPVLLLDEATSALDAESEKVVQDALERLSEGRTTLIIAHRLSTVREADQILVLEQGKLVEQGTHDALLEAEGGYARLHDLQFQTGMTPFSGSLPAMSNGDTGAVAIMPYHIRPRFSLSGVKLDDLIWPLGRPERLPPEGTVADLTSQDHLIVHSRKQLYWQPRIMLKAKLSVMIVEPDAIHGAHAQLAKRFSRRFHRILTRRVDLLQTLPNARKLTFGTTFLSDWPADDVEKTKQVSLVASDKTQYEGHKLRHEAVKRLNASSHQVDVMGRGYAPFENKADALLPYRYSIVIENVREPSYFTEKLVDALLCRCVPIYWGAPDIGDYFDPGGMIICNSLDEMMDALDGIGKDDYAARKPAIDANMNRAEEQADLYHRAARTVLTT